MFGALALAGALFGGGWLWRGSRSVATPVVVVDTVLVQQGGSGALGPPPAPVGSPAPPPAPGTATSATRLADRLPVDSLDIVQRGLKDLRERRFRDSVAAEKQAADDRRIRDSLAVVARQEQEARQRLEAQARAEQLERERREAEIRAAQESAATAAMAEREREARLAAGATALNVWLNSLVRNANAGAAAAPVLAAGPPEFAAFVRKNRPKLSDARLLTTAVNEETGEATAEWVAKWRTAFGPATSRHMKATATVVPDGDTWQLQNWRITEGAP